jgi:hypothetical protein
LAGTGKHEVYIGCNGSGGSIESPSPPAQRTDLPHAAEPATNGEP